ncbi:MAG: hypothetical protein H2043_10985 [Rhizobiales bacterium]|nr:hypothetical protein [Hyphomicrobiales bacterium]
MIIEIDFAKILKAASELPEEADSPEAIGDEGLRTLYKETDGRWVLDREAHRVMVGQLKAAAERDELEAENRRLRDQSDRRLVVDHVRQSLAKMGVRPELLGAATAQFLSAHKCAVRDGKVIVEGKLGRTDAELAAVSWLADEPEAYTAPPVATTGGFAAEVARLKKMH